jgi:hypothetical protein
VSTSVSGNHYYAQYVPDVSNYVAQDITVTGSSDAKISPLQFLVDMPIYVGCYKVRAFTINLEKRLNV